MMKLIVKKLKNNAISRIGFPQNDEEKQYYVSLIEQREPSIKNCIGFVDGLSVACQCSSEITEQNKDYNGYKHDTSVNNVLAFAPTGKVIYGTAALTGTAASSAFSSFSLSLAVGPKSYSLSWLHRHHQRYFHSLRLQK